MRNFIKVLKCKRGQAMVEMALVLPVLVLLLMGIIDFGRIIHSQQEITAAAREGARIAAITRSATQARTAVKSMAVDLALADGDILVNWGDPDAFPAPMAQGSSVTITVTNKPQIFFALIADALTSAAGGSFTLTGNAVMMVE